MATDQSYEFIYDEFEQAYLFATRYQVRFAIRFKPSFYLLDTDPMIAENVYEIVIAVTGRPVKPPPPDERVYYTICSSRAGFFQKARTCRCIRL